MTCFAVLASATDVEDGKFRRLVDYKTNEHIITFPPSGTGTLTKPDRLNCAGVLVFAPDFLRQHREQTAAILVREDVTGIFIHPSLGNTPKKADAHRVLDRLLGGIALPNMDVVKKKSVAFTNNGDKEYRVAGLLAIWEWLMDSPTKAIAGSMHHPDMASISRDYERFWRRDNVDLLVELVILLQGSTSQDVSVETCREWRNDFLDCMRNGEAKWVTEDRTLGPATKAILAALDGTNMGQLDSATQQFLTAVRGFVSDVTVRQDRGH